MNKNYYNYYCPFDSSSCLSTVHFDRAIHFRAKRGIEIACRPSVCDVGGSGSRRLEVLETNCTDSWPNTFALRNPKTIHLIPGEHREILGRLEVGWEKVACWSTKAAISLKSVKTDEKLLWMAYRNSPTLPVGRRGSGSVGTPSPRLMVHNPHPEHYLRNG